MFRAKHIGDNVKYIIVSLLGGEVKSYHQKLVQEISEKFSVDFLVNQNAPTHYTIKDIFETENIEEVDQVLYEFAKNHRPTKITLQGYNRFEDNVIYMDIRFSDEGKLLFEQFIAALRNITWMQWGNYDDEKRKFHCTLAYFDIKDKYKDICRFLLNNYSYSFEAYFDNITVYKQVGENWELHKSFPLKHSED